jgi:hypothetical protein
MSKNNARHYPCAPTTPLNAELYPNGLKNNNQTLPTSNHPHQKPFFNLLRSVGSLDFISCSVFIELLTEPFYGLNSVENTAPTSACKFKKPPRKQIRTNAQNKPT